MSFEGLSSQNNTKILKKKIIASNVFLLIATVSFKFICTFALLNLISLHLPKNLSNFKFFDQLSASQALQPTEEAFQRSVSEHLGKTQEFQFIRLLAEKMKVRVWLFGGTAASAAHYYYNNLQRLNGDTRFQADRFTYDYTDIFRSTQDLDIAVDGTLEQVEEFQKHLAEKYPQFLGARADWEVRSLRHSRGIPGKPGYKEALINSFDFENQNTDSNSLAMIEITQSPNPKVTDLKQMSGARDSQFLKDVLQEKITFYRSSLHFQTARAKIGENPEIFSVIRALTKAFQYDLKIESEDLKEMKEIINAFDVRTIQGSQAKKRFKEISVKLIKHAVNIEYAVNKLNELGLKAKLLNYDNKDEGDSLAFWINKEPLRSFAIGRGEGKTAREIFKHKKWINENGQLIVTHETRSYLAYESIVRSTTGEPNVFISRKDTTKELAEYGNGFYVRVGKEGAQGTKISIHFHLDENARLCKSKSDFNCDFWIHGDYLVIRNKKALKIIPESLNLTLLQYLSILQNGDSLSENKALEEKFKRRLVNLQENLTEVEIKKIILMVQEVLHEPFSIKNETFNNAWFSLAIAEKFPDLLNLYENNLKLLIEKSDQTTLVYLAKYTFSLPHSKRMSALLILLIKNADQDTLQKLALYTFSQPHTKGMTDPLSLLIEKANQHTLRYLAEHTFSQPHTKDMTAALSLLIEKADQTTLQSLAKFTFSQPHTKDMTGPLSLLIEKADQETLQKLALFTFSQSHTKNMKALLKLIIEKANQFTLQYLAKNTFSHPHTQDMTELIKLMIEKANEQTLHPLIFYIFSKPLSKDMIELLRFLIEKEDQFILQKLAEYAFSKPYTKDFSDLLQMLIEKADQTTLQKLARFTFSQAHTSGMTVQLKLLIEKADQETLQRLAQYTFSQPHTKGMTALLKLLIEKANQTTLQNLAFYTFSKSHTKNMTGLLRLLIEKADQTTLAWLNGHVLSEPHASKGDVWELFRRATIIQDKSERIKFLEEYLGLSSASGVKAPLIKELKPISPTDSDQNRTCQTLFGDVR